MPTRLTTLLAFALCTALVHAQFSPQRVIDLTEVSMPYDVRLGDIDGDGDQDVLYTTFSSDTHVAWFPNNGDGYCLPRRAIDGGGSYMAVQLVDMDQDGDLDVLGISAYPGDVFWVENDGAGNFGTAQLINAAGSGGKDVYAADLDGDGDMDVLSATYDSERIAWYANDGTQQFGPQQIITTMGGAYGVRAADLDADGDMDVVGTGQGTPGVVWFSNNGSGAFSPMSALLPTLASGGVVAIADINGDGHPDIAAQGLSAAHWYANDGLGAFTDGGAFVVGLGMHVEDLDGDGDVDVVNGNGGTQMRTWTNDGSGVFGNSTIIADGYDAWDADVADMNGDGIVDVVGGYYDDSHLLINVGLGGGAFDAPRVIASEADDIRSLCAADLNGDGLNEVIEAVANENKVAWFPNTGGNAFGLEQVVSTAASGANTVRAADVDGDGDMDLLSAGHVFSSSFHTRWYPNDGTGVFGPGQTISSGNSGSFTIEVGDMDGDGDPDVVGANASQQTMVFTNDGAGTFTEGGLIPSASPQAMALADLDGDGDLDVLCAYFSVDAFLNDGTGNFTQSFTAPVGANAVRQIAALDMDGDGTLDISYCTVGPGLVYLHGNGDGTFETTTYLVSLDGNLTSYAHGDVDGDGLVDLLVEAGGSLFWSRNSGGGVFTQQTTPITLVAGSCVVHLADLDGDGDLDPIAGSPNYGHLFWNENYYLSPYRFEGTVFLDNDGDGAQDPGEPGLPNLPLHVDPTIPGLFPLAQGEYTAHVEFGTFSVGVNTDPLTWIVTTPDPRIVDITEADPVQTGIDVGVTPVQDRSHLSPTITQAPAVCGANTHLWLSLANLGTRVEEGMIRLVLDTAFTFVSSVPPPDAVVGDTLAWDFTGMLPFDTRTIPVVVTLPPADQMGTAYQHLLSVMALDEFNMLVAAGNTHLADTLLCSYDPNDKLVDPKGYGIYGAVEIGADSLDYTIRFQNTGSAPAQTVVLRDVLDGILDPARIQLLGSSHTITGMQVGIDDEMVVRFDGIQLPAMAVNELGSQGFVRFRTKTDEGAVQHLSTAHNTAGIFFDLNAPVITNTTLTTWVDCAQWQPTVEMPGPDSLRATNGDAYQWYRDGGALAGQTGQYLVPDLSGSYAVEVTSTYGCVALSEPVAVVITGIASNTSGTVLVRPNPFTSGTQLVFSEALSTQDRIDLCDVQGRSLRSWHGTGARELWIPRADLMPGMYTVHVMRAGERVAAVRLMVE